MAYKTSLLSPLNLFPLNPAFALNRIFPLNHFVSRLYLAHSFHHCPFASHHLPAPACNRTAGGLSPKKRLPNILKSNTCLQKIKPKALSQLGFKSFFPISFFPSDPCKGCKRNRLHRTQYERVLHYFIRVVIYH